MIQILLSSTSDRAVDQISISGDFTTLYYTTDNFSLYYGDNAYSVIRASDNAVVFRSSAHITSFADHRPNT